jgi:hypothetical protein
MRLLTLVFDHNLLANKMNEQINEHHVLVDSSELC